MRTMHEAPQRHHAAGHHAAGHGAAGHGGAGHGGAGHGAGHHTRSRAAAGRASSHPKAARHSTGSRLGAWLALAAMPALSWWCLTATWGMWVDARATWTVEDAVLLACGVIASAFSAYLGLTGLLLILASLAGTGSAIARGVAAIMPAGWRRLVTVALGVTLTATAAPAFAGASVGWAGGDDAHDAPVAGIGWVAPQPSVATHTPAEVAGANPAEVAAATPAEVAAATAAPAEAPSGTAAVAPAAAPAEPSSATYTVKPGDSLWSIAEAQLESGSTHAQASNSQVSQAWQIIYQDNQETIGDDPGLILPGQVLVIAQEVAQ